MKRVNFALNFLGLLTVTVTDDEPSLREAGSFMYPMFLGLSGDTAKVGEI
jgi:hypothetical protein